MIHSLPKVSGARNARACLTVAVLLIDAASARCQDLITCGWSEVRGWRLTGTNAVNLWTWTATNSNLPDWAKPLFTTTSDCKPCPGNRVLVTSSGGDSLQGAVALVEPWNSNVLFVARATNAHSAELLPANRVAVAVADDYAGTADRLVVFDLSQPNVELISVNLQAAHGVVWDEERQVLWGLALPYLRAYRLQNWNSQQPGLSVLSTTSLPGFNGHDLYPVPDSPDLLIATDLNCWLFNRDTGTFRKHPLLGDITNVKGLSIHPMTGRIVYVRGEIQWWSENLQLLSPDGTSHLAGEHFYKARWRPGVLPRLTIHRAGTNSAILSWPSASTEFSLQQNTNLLSPGWSADSGGISNDGTNHSVVISPTTPIQFYRLVWNPL